MEEDEGEEEETKMKERKMADGNEEMERVAWEVEEQKRKSGFCTERKEE